MKNLPHFLIAGLLLVGYLHAAEASTEAAEPSSQTTDTPMIVAEAPAATTDDLVRLQQQLESSDAEERTKARESLEKTAVENVQEAGVVLGNGWLRGLFSETPDADKAIEWWTKAGEAGNGHAWWLLGALYNGDLDKRDVVDETKATDAFRKAADADYVDAYLPLGSRLLNGIGCEADEAAGLDWLNKTLDEARKAKAQNRPANFFAYVVAARYFAKQGADEKALDALRQGVEEEDAECMMELFRMLIGEERSAEQKQEALALAEKAADTGLPEAVREMVVAERVKDVPRKLKIYEWLQKAALGGDALLQQELGTLHYRGWFTGVREPAAAAYWLALAARAGLPQARYFYGNQLEKGDGVARDFKAAFEYFKAAMEQGHPGATLAYARYLPDGGYPAEAGPDLARAWAVGKLAKGRAQAANDSQLVTAASAFIGTLSERMEPEQLVEAKKVYTELEQEEEARLAEITKRQEEAKAAAEAKAEAEALKAKEEADAAKAENEALGLEEGDIPLGTIPVVDERPPGE